MSAGLLSQLWVLEQYGPQEPSSLTGPIRVGKGKYGDGLLVEQGTTNLITNPSFETGITGYQLPGSAAAAVSTTRSMFGAQSCLVTIGVSGSTGIGYTVNAGAVGDSTVYTVSAWVFIPVGSPAVRFSIQGAIVASTVTGGFSTSNGRWERISCTFTTVAGASALTGVIYLITTGTSTSQQFWTDGWQLEAKASATSYADGSLATAWNAPGNLIPAAAAQSFEDGTLGGWTTNVATLTNSAAQFYAGTKALLATVTSTATLNVISPTGTSASPVVAGKTYTGSLWVRPSAARQLRADIVWYTAAGAVISTAPGTAVAGGVATWQRVSVSGVAPATAAFAAVQYTSTDSTNADTVYLDGVRIEEGTGAAAYRWTGAENASASTRTAGFLVHALPTLMANLVSAAVLVRVGTPVSTATMFPRPVHLGTTADGFSIYLNNGSVYVVKLVATVTVQVQLALSLVPGDLLFLALTYDGTTLTAYGSKNGGVISSATAASATIPADISQVAVGGHPGGANQSDSVVEQVLIYRGSLTSTEVQALAAVKVETGFKDDARIVLAAGTGIVRGTVRAATVTGTGYYRPSRAALAADLEDIVAIGPDPGDDNSSIKITVPAGSGVGQGQLVSLSPDGSGRRFTVHRVFAPGGAYDELLVS